MTRVLVQWGPMALSGVGSCTSPAGHVSGFHKHSEEGGQGCQPHGNGQKDHQAQNISSPVPLSSCVLPTPV